MTATVTNGSRASPGIRAARLRWMRQTHDDKPTQQQVADAVGLSRARLSEIENNKGQQLGVDELHALAAYYGQTVDWFQRPVRQTTDAVGVFRNDGPI